MRLKIDENMWPELAGFLRDSGHDACTAREEGLGGSGDEDLIAVAASEGRTFLTFDLDFADIRRYPPASSAGIIVVRIPDPTFDEVATVLASQLRRAEELGASPHRHLWVITRNRLRVRPAD